MTDYEIAESRREHRYLRAEIRRQVRASTPSRMGWGKSIGGRWLTAAAFDIELWVTVAGPK